MELPHAHVTRAVVQRYARLLLRHRGELGKRPLVLPNSAFFPDTFMGDAASLATLAARMQVHAGLEDIPIRTSVVSYEGPEREKSHCGDACSVPSNSGNGGARVVDNGDFWHLQIPEAELRHPVALTTNLARSLAFIFLVETQRPGEILEPPVDVTADFVAVALGFGPLLLEGSYIYAKSCSGPRVASVTKVPLAELAISVALFAALGDHDLRPTLKTLSPTQKELLVEANLLIKNNADLIGLLETRPEEVEGGNFELEESRGLLSGFFRKKKKNKAAPPEPSGDNVMDLEDVESLLISMPPSSQVGHRNRKVDPELAELVSESLREASA